jgi:hypothetical protein
MQLKERLVVTLIAAMACFPPFVTAASLGTGITGPGLQSPPVLKEPLQLEIFADRSVVKDRESIKVSVWVESSILESGSVTVLVAEDQLVLNGAASYSLPRNSPIIFALRGKHPGKSNILVRMQGVHKDTKEMVSASQRLEGIEVQARTSWWSPLPSSSLLGVAVGALLTFGATWLHERRQQRREKVQRRRWVLVHLPALLAFDRTAVQQSRETRFESWRSRLLTEGYYAEVEQLIGQHTNLKDLANKLISTGFLLQDYEDRRVQKRLEPQLQQHLETELDEIIRGLKRLAGEA